MNNTLPRAAFHTLGCRLNQSETATAADDLRHHGFQHVPWGEPAELLVINTCAVTAAASQKSRQTMRAARKTHPDAFIVLMGCDALVDRETWEEDDGPDLVIPHPAPAPLSTLLPSPLPHHTPARKLFVEPAKPDDDFTAAGAAIFSERTRASLKIQDGCSFFCSYCIVPHTRGPARSRDIRDVLREARCLIEGGARELVLCGVNLTTYSSDGVNLAGLLRELAALGDGFRIRLGSAEPGPVIPEVVDAMLAMPGRVCRFLHMPLQYGEDSILRAMRRHYSTAQYRDMAMDAIRRIPGICIGADVIAGFPGETPEAFTKCRDFLESIPFGLLHIFPFSPRPGTPAASFNGQVAHKTAAERAALLTKLARAKAESFARSQINTPLELLVEHLTPPSGWSDNYLHLILPSNTTAERNSLITAIPLRLLHERELDATPLGARH